MKNLLFFATAVLAATPTLDKRQASVIIDAIASVSQSVSALDAAVNSFSGIDQATSLLNAASAVESAISSASSTIQPLGQLTQGDAINLAQPISDLADLVESSIQDVISKKSEFDSLNVSGVVYANLVQLRDGAGGLADEILGKIPNELQSVGQGLAARITTALDNGVSAYQDASSAPSTLPTATSTAVETTAAPTSATTEAPVTTAPTTASTTTSVAGSSTTARPTTVSATTTRPSASATTVSVYPGAAAPNAASGFGAAAAAVLAMAAML